MFCRVLLCAVTVLLGQIPAEREQRMRLAEANPTPGSTELQAVRSDRITRALRSPDDLWAFVTSPEPMYLERRAAAYQAKGLVPVTWLPKIWRAIGELRREQAASDFGLKPHPISSTVYMPRRPRREGPRPILGHTWTPPAQPIDYPLTPEEREKAPWPWQVQQALSDLDGGLVPSTYSPLEREKADAYLAAVLTMPCATDEEATWLVSAVQSSSHYKTAGDHGDAAQHRAQSAAAARRRPCRDHVCGCDAAVERSALVGPRRGRAARHSAQQPARGRTPDRGLWGASLRERFRGRPDDAAGRCRPRFFSR